MEANSTISTTTIVLSVLSSSVLATVFTKTLDYYFSKISYKKDYYKKILDKRFSSYLMLTDIIEESSLNFLDDNKKAYTCIFVSRNVFWTHYDKLASVSKNKTWFTNETSTLLKKYVEFIVEIVIVFKFNREDTEDTIFINAAIQNNQNLINLKMDVEKAILKDLLVLDNVGDFLKNRYI